MQIEIVTTKKKLTKSILSQMPEADTLQMSNGKVLGYIMNSVKDTYKVFLIESNLNYYILPANLHKGGNVKKVYRKLGKWTRHKEFATEEACNDYWIWYVELVNDKHHQQIYI